MIKHSLIARGAAVALVALSASALTALCLAADPPAPETTEPAPPLLDPNKDRPGLKVGEPAPDVTLSDLTGSEKSLANLYKHGPVVITFYRGDWCPFCTKALEGWQDQMPALTEAGATFVAISPEARPHQEALAESIELDCIVLCDARGEAMRRFRVGFMLPEDTKKKYSKHGIDLSTHNATGEWSLPAPATFVIDRDGVVRWAHADWNYTQRAEPKDVVKFVKTLAADR